MRTVEESEKHLEGAAHWMKLLTTKAEGLQ